MHGHLHIKGNARDLSLIRHYGGVAKTNNDKLLVFGHSGEGGATLIIGIVEKFPNFPGTIYRYVPGK